MSKPQSANSSILSLLKSTNLSSNNDSIAPINFNNANEIAKSPKVIISTSNSARLLQKIQTKRSEEAEKREPLNSTTTNLLCALDEAIVEDKLEQRAKRHQQAIAVRKAATAAQKITCSLLDDPDKAIPQKLTYTGDNNGTQDVCQYVTETYKRQVLEGDFELKQKELLLSKKNEYKITERIVKLPNNKSRRANKRHAKAVEKGINYKSRVETVMSKQGRKKSRQSRFNPY